MECTSCQGESARAESAQGQRMNAQTCPQCEQPTDSAASMGEECVTGATRIVESSADGKELRVSYMPARVDPEARGVLVPDTPAYPMLATLARLPALAWRQPVVRAAVKTGASAVALTVALRLTGRVLASGSMCEAPRESMLPTLADLISPAESHARPLRRVRRARRAQREQVSEVFIYVRRTVRG